MEGGRKRGRKDLGGSDGEQWVGRSQGEREGEREGGREGGDKKREK